MSNIKMICFRMLHGLSPAWNENAEKLTLDQHVISFTRPEEILCQDDPTTDYGWSMSTRSSNYQTIFESICSKVSSLLGREYSDSHIDTDTKYIEIAILCHDGSIGHICRISTDPGVLDVMQDVARLVPEYEEIPEMLQTPHPGILRH